MTEELDWLSLEPGEELVWSGKPRIRRILPTVFRAIVWAGVGFVAAIVAVRFFDVPVPVPDVAIWGAAVLWALVQAGGVLSAYVETTNIDYVLTTQNVYKKTGVLSENVSRIGVDKIQNTRLSKDFLGNVFDYGTVFISTAGSGGVNMAIRDLDDPDELRNELRTRIATARERSRADAQGLPPEQIGAVVDEVSRIRETAERMEELVT